ncbi:MAG: bifunctional oligoribonuclease/PAP phosphatase NrnA [Erysipelothrix sp.]|nr:bifunctional oligoribonuclease/PAP phosphatase NrnA [Erysipelothrix sp.]
MIREIVETIEAYETIIVFRHLEGDGDALGSQWAMFHYLSNKYPNKQVYAVGDDPVGYESIYPMPHTIDDTLFKGALGIVLDTANHERISDHRYRLCDTLIKIDHHLPVDNYAQINVVDEHCSSCSEILANILKTIEENSVLPYDVARYLYSGIISDTQGFSISSVTKSTFDTASYLMESKIKPFEISQKLRQIDLKTFQFQAYVSNKITYVTDNFAYLQIDQSDLVTYKLDVQNVKYLVNIMRSIGNIKVWALFIETSAQTYSASIRSHGHNINKVAQRFNGGGHLQASGVKNLKEESKTQLIQELKDVSEEVL